MKFLIKTYHQCEDWDADHMLIELQPETVARLRELSGQCIKFLTEMDARFFGNVELGFELTGLSYPQFGCYSFEVIPDGHYEKELDDQGWTSMDHFLGGEEIEWEEEAVECLSVRFVRDGDMLIVGMDKYSSNVVEALLYKEMLDAVLQPTEAK